jgi:branched-subunit amino acid aminotransferase/4-amino-4-deoxychorismate lyase
MITYFDGEFVDDEKAKISVRSRAVNYGLGCFGGVRGYLADDGEQVLLFRVPDHMLRLQHSAKVLFMRLPGDHAYAVRAGPGAAAPQRGPPRRVRPADPAQ